jgi:hypothetical protein
MPDAAKDCVKAAEMRDRAKSAHDPVAHQELLSLAKQYDALAREVGLFPIEGRSVQNSD